VISTITVLTCVVKEAAMTVAVCVAATALTDHKGKALCAATVATFL
jgi:hypothetical protein